MAYPFQRLTTEKLKKVFKKVVERNCNIKDTNSCRKKHADKKPGNKLTCPVQVLESWIQREINL
jgi:hypothetical protein